MMPSRLRSISLVRQSTVWPTLIWRFVSWRYVDSRVVDSRFDDGRFVYRQRADGQRAVRASAVWQVALVIVLGWGNSIIAPLASAAYQDQPPHIIFLMADDLGYNDVGFNGGKDIATPHIDRLAQEGAVLRAMYVQPSCSATRAAFLTGRYPIRYGLQSGNVRHTDEFGLSEEETTIADELNRVGYHTAMIGKWHLGWAKPEYLPLARGFDEQYGMLRADYIDYYKHTHRDFGLDWYRQQVPLEEEGYSTDLIADEAARLIREHEEASPLFLFVAFNAPHSPLQIPRDDDGQRYEQLTRVRGRYAQMVSSMDRSIGRILAALDERGFADNTIVIFSSDNGGAAPGDRSDNAPFRGGKGTMYEGGVRACACIRWPGMVKPQVYEPPLHIVDWFPTLLAAANITPSEASLDGRNRMYQLVGGDAQLETPILIHARPSSAALRKGDWKLLRWQNQDEGANEELYNVVDDPAEAKDLADQFPWRVADLRRDMEAFERDQVTPLRHLSTDEEGGDEESADDQAADDQAADEANETREDSEDSGRVHENQAG